MSVFFVHDYRSRYRYFSSEPVEQVQVTFSCLKKVWEVAKQKLMLLPRRILAQEQAFEQTLKFEDSEVKILYSGRLSEKRIRMKFYFFLQKQRTKHIVLLVGESLLLPLSGLMALLPGPNIFFGVLALLMYTHWQALRGINKLLKKSYQFLPQPALNDWERAAKAKRVQRFPEVLESLEREYGLKSFRKILWR